MIIFKKFLIINEAKNREEILTDIISRLESNEFLVKIKNNRVYAYTKGNRLSAMNKILEIFKDKNARFIKPDNKTVRNLSSIGVISLDGDITVIVKPLGRNRKEAEEKASNDLDKLIKDAVNENGGPITVKIGDLKLKNIVSASSKHIVGDPKADITLIDNKDKEIGFISHKKEGGASSFQQYSGLSKQSGVEIYNNKLVKNFIKDIHEYMESNYNSNVAESGMSFKRKVPNSTEGKKLVGMSVFGFNWTLGGKNFSRNFVQCIGQGDPILKKQGKVYELDFFDAMHVSKDIAWAFKGEYRAYFAATYRVGRRIESEDIIVENLRGGIYPEGFISGRNAIEL